MSVIASTQLRDAYLSEEVWTPEARTDLDWQDDALCAQISPEMFFPDKGESTKSAKDICRGCDVREQCLAYAIKQEHTYGVWGGLSPRERRKLDPENKPAPQRARELRDQVARLHKLGQTDTQISAALSKSWDYIHRVRKELGLATNEPRRKSA